MSQGIKPAQERPWVRHAICYGLYALLLVLTVIVVFVIWRQSILVMLALFMAQSRLNRSIYLFSITLLGLGSFAFVIGAESYIRNGLDRDGMVQRFLRLAKPLLIGGAVGLLINLFGTLLLEAAAEP